MHAATPPQNHTTEDPRALAGGMFKSIREAHGIGQAELARLVGISRSHLSRVEKGERILSPQLHMRLVNALADLPRSA